MMRARPRLRKFHSFSFSLAISNARVESWIADRRKERNPDAGDQNAVIDSITEGEDDETTLSEGNEDVVDHILRGN